MGQLRRGPLCAAAAGVVGLLVCVCGCRGSTHAPDAHLVGGSTAVTARGGPTVLSHPTVEKPGRCRGRGSGRDELPDPSCTPGAVDPAVTQADLDTTICSTGWTAAVRPPESVTEPLKFRQMAAYGDAGPASAYEEDHLIPLELGGSPADPQNLWPEPGASPNPKDRVETAAKHRVCDGTMTLTAAQRAIAANWVELGRQLGVVGAPSAAASPQGDRPACRVTASFNRAYGDWDVYVHSNRPDRTVTVRSSGGATASWDTDATGSADVYLHVGRTASGQRVTVVVGAASCSTTLPS